MPKPKVHIDKALEDFDLKGQAQSLAHEYEQVFGCPCEVHIRAVTWEGEDDLGHRIRIEHSVRPFDEPA